MPVTAKLSKRFYAVDLAYRTDLRELNDLNFVRFDAKLEQRVAELRAELRSELQMVRTEVHQVRAGLLRWMFGFWVTTLLGIAGVLVAIVRYGP